MGTFCTYKKGEFGHTYTDTHLHMKIKAEEMGEVLLQTKECWRLSADHEKLGERHGRDASSRLSEGTKADNTSILDF